jgi:hypothetical protein
MPGRMRGQQDQFLVKIHRAKCRMIDKMILQVIIGRPYISDGRIPSKDKRIKRCLLTGELGGGL